jgi:hypothetical protein
MSGTVIVTKYSLTSAQPASNALAQGEQAYSFISDKLWIGEDNGTNIDPIAIGGKFYTDQLPAASSAFGTLVANQALVVDSNKKINELNVDNITIDGNTLSTTNTNGTLTIDPNGTGDVDIQATLNVVGNLTVSGTQSFTGQTTLTSLNVTDLTDNRVLIAGSNGEVEDSSALTFNGSALYVNATANITGNVDIDSQLTAASVNVEDLTSGRVVLAGTSGELEDSGNLTFNGTTLAITGVVDADNIRLNGNIISSIDTNGGLTITPNGTGTVTVDTDTALIIPQGSEGTRPSASGLGDGAIRYNTTDNRFEGSVSGAWTGLGGVVDVDQDTYITAEASTDDDTLTFVAANSTEMTIDSTGVDITDRVTVPIANITTSNETTANIGTANITSALTVSTSSVDFQNGIDVTNGNVDITDNLNVDGNTIIGGNLTVNGTTTTVNSTVTELSDPVIKVGEGSLATGDANDRGINFDYGDGSNVKTGFFGMDMQTGRFSFKKDVDTADENYVATWSDAQFDKLFLSGDASIDDNLILSANDITTTAGDLTIAPAGGDTNITGTLDVSGAASADSLTLTNDLAVTEGGTGLSSFTGDSIFISNAAGTAVGFIAPPSTNPEDYIIKFNSSGVPVASNVIDGGTF